MSIEARFDTIRTRFQTQVLDVLSKTGQFDNAPFDKPEDDTWFRWTILLGDAQQVSVGPPKQFRYPGIGRANIFVPIEQGDEAAIQAADTIVTAFGTVTDTGVTFRTPTGPRNIGRDGRWWQWNVDCPFYFDLYV